jgi:dihydroorotate dehydrogenase (NAD+) catalytic subunit
MTAPSTAPSTDLTTTLAGMTMPSPVMTAAGCGGTGRELASYDDLTTLGAFTTRTITLDARAGAPAPRVADTAAGVLTDTGMQNPGLQGFLASELPWLAQQQVRTVVSIAAATLGEYAELARRLGTSPGVSGVEVNLDGLDADPYQAGKVLHVVRRDVPRGVAVLAKLSPGPGVADVARSVVKNGADAVVLVHGFPGLLFDPTTLRPVLGAGPGSVSGPAVLAQALRCVWDVHAALPDVPLVGAGGVRTGFDALQMLLAGATAVQVGSVLMHDPSAPRRIAAELADELCSRGVDSPADLVGRGHHPPEGNQP